MNNNYTNEIKQHNLKWPYIPDHPYIILLNYPNLINIQPDIEKIYLYAKDPYETKHQYLIISREKSRIISL